MSGGRGFPTVSTQVGGQRGEAEKGLAAEGAHRSVGVLLRGFGSITGALIRIRQRDHAFLLPTANAQVLQAVALSCASAGAGTLSLHPP